MANFQNPANQEVRYRYNSALILTPQLHLVIGVTCSTHLPNVYAKSPQQLEGVRSVDRTYL